MAISYSVILPTATSHGKVASSSFADALANFSVSVWLKTTESVDYHHVVGKLNDGVGDGGWELAIATGQLFYNFWTTGHGAQYRGYTVNTVNDGLWHNIILTYDSVAGASVYIDGTLQTITGATGVPPGTGYSTSVYFGLGNTASDVNSSTTGNIAYVQFWNATLSASNAAIVASNGDVSSGLIAKWTLVESTGLTAADSVGGNTLTFTAVAWSLDVPPALISAVATALVQVLNFPATQPVSELNIDKSFGIWSYYAGTSGTVIVAASLRVVGITAHATSAATVTINGGDTITIPAGASFAVGPLGNLTAPTVVFTGTDAYFIEVVG